MLRDVLVADMEWSLVIIFENYDYDITKIETGMISCSTTMLR